MNNQDRAGGEREVNPAIITDKEAFELDYLAAQLFPHRDLDADLRFAIRTGDMYINHQRAAFKQGYQTALTTLQGEVERLMRKAIFNYANADTSKSEVDRMDEAINQALNPTPHER